MLCVYNYCNSSRVQNSEGFQNSWKPPGPSLHPCGTGYPMAIPYNLYNKNMFIPVKQL